jgi:uncharacterized membrane protein YgcG
VAQPALPAFTGDPVLVQGVAGDFGDLRTALRALNASSPRDYYAVLVASTAPEEAARYLDRLVDSWTLREPGFDALLGVVTLVAVEDRQVSMLAGDRLRSEFGLTAEVIDRDLVGPFFAPRARSGDLGGALEALVRATDQWLERRGAPRAARVSEDAARRPARAPSSMPPPRARVQTRAADATRASPPIPPLWLGWGLGGVLALGVGGLWWLRVSRHRRAEKAVREPFHAFSARVVNLLDRVEALSRRHQLLPFSDPDYQQPMAGETAALYDRTDGEIRRLRQTWLDMMGVHDQIKLIVDHNRRLSAAQMEEIRGLMRVQEQMEAAIPVEEQCVRQLDDLEQAHERAGAIRTEAEQAVAARQEQMRALEEAGLSVMPYEAEFQSARDLLEQGVAVLVPDPVGTMEVLREATTKLEALGGWLSRILAGTQRRTAIAAALDAAAADAVEKRKQGLALREEEGNPDPMVAQGRHELEAAGMALNRGESDDADAYLDQAEAWARDAAEVIRRQEEARLYCEGAVPARSQRAAALEEHRRRADTAMERLKAGYAAASWEGVSGNVVRAAQVLDGLPALLERARAESTPETQRYFHAEDLLVHIEQQQEQAAALLDAVERRLEELQEEREICAGLRHEVETRARELEACLAAHRRALGADVRALADTAHEARRHAQEEEAAALPHWPLVRNRLELALRDLGETMETAQTEVAAWEEVEQALAATERELSSLDDLLRRHHEDRPQANRLGEEARRTWELIRREAQEPGAPWDDLAARLRDVSARIDQARRLAEQDISLARQAAEAIQAGERDTQLARAYYQSGVRADADAADRNLQRARQALRQQQYEAALEEAGEASREAQAAVSRARRLARERQRIQTQQRMAQTASILVQAAAAYAGARQGSSSGRRHLSMPTPPLRIASPHIPNRPTFPSRGGGSSPPRSSQSHWGGNTGPRSSQSSW